MSSTENDRSAMRSLVYRPAVNNHDTAQDTALPANRLPLVEVLIDRVPKLSSSNENQQNVSNEPAMVGDGSRVLLSDFSEQELKDEAESRGYQAGGESTMEAFKHEKNKNTISVLAALNEIASFRSELERRIQPKIVALSLRIAEKILCSRIQIDSLSLAATVRVCLDESPIEGIMTLKVSPTDHLSWLNLFGAVEGGIVSVVISVDPALHDGMCRVETAFGNADYSAEMQLNEIGNRFRRMLGEGESRPCLP